MPRLAPAIALDSATQSVLKGWVQAPSTPQALALRSRIVLKASAGLSNQQIAAELEIPEVTVGKWRRSFAQLGWDGLRDAPRSGRPPKHDVKIRQKVQTLACQQPESQGRWTVRTLARQLGLPHSTVHTILQASDLPLHRIRTFTFSPDPDFEAKLLDIVGLYLNPPENALLLCVDEKTRHPGVGSNATAAAVASQEATKLDQRICASRNANPDRGIGNSHWQDRCSHSQPTHLGELSPLYERCRARLSGPRFTCYCRQPEHPQERSGPPLAAPTSPSSIPLHSHARFLGESNRVLLQYPDQARLGAQRTAVQERPQGSSPAVSHSVQLNCRPFTWTKGPEQLQRIIETTKQYQVEHPRKPRRRRNRGKKPGSIKD